MQILHSAVVRLRYSLCGCATLTFERDDWEVPMLNITLLLSVYT